MLLAEMTGGRVVTALADEEVAYAPEVNQLVEAVSQKATTFLGRVVEDAPALRLELEHPNS
jgi:hypothetical protein